VEKIVENPCTLQGADGVSIIQGLKSQRFSPRNLREISSDVVQFEVIYGAAV